MRKIAIFIAVSVLLLLCSTPALAQGIPTLPHAFYGSVTVNGAPASNGTQVSATVDSGSVITNAQNPVTTVGGSYGINSPYLLVQGDIPLGATVTFYVNGVKAEGVTAIFEAGGGPTKRDLSVIIAAPPSVGEPGVGPPTYYIKTNLFGVVKSYPISYSGKLEKTIEATSEDGMLAITIPKGTIALDKDGKRLKSLQVAVDETPPDPPEDAHIIGLAYDFGPDGATFDPAITLEYTYDPAEIPEGVAEEDLVVSWYDHETGKWEECECTCDPEGNCITACVCHFTCFAIIAHATPPPLALAPAAFSVSDLSIQPAEVQPKESVTITVSVANTGGTEGRYTVVLKINGVEEAEKSVTVTAGDSQLVTFTVAKEEAGTYSVTVDGLSGNFTVMAPAPEVPPPTPEVEAPLNWSLIGGVIAAVVIVGLVIFFVVRRRAE